LISKFGGLAKILKYAFPDVLWDERRFSLRGKRAAQRYEGEVGGGRRGRREAEAGARRQERGTFYSSLSQVAYV
jgi:hypothetical protein